jgi:hypothetical protein
MSANIQQQMAAAGQLMPQQGQPGRPNQAQLGTLVYRALMGNSLPIQGWQTAVPITERMGKTLNLYVASRSIHHKRFSGLLTRHPIASLS